jgi:glycosyltransferase involved in cell wall biosynthesis
MSKPLVFVIAAMPPPVHGQSAVTANIVSMLFQSSCKTILVDTSPGRLERSLAYHLIRMRKLAVAILRLLAASFQRSKRMYTVVESGAGIAYNFLSVLLCRALGYELFLHHHTARHIAKRSEAVALLAMLAGKKASHIVLSDHMVADLRSHYPAIKRTQTLHNAGNVASFARTQTSDGRRLRLGLLANLSIEKGLDTAIATGLAAAEAGLSIKLILAGPPGDPAAHSTVAQICRDADLFEYRGPVYGQAKRAFFEGLDVFLFPTRYAHEAQPLVVLEAMAAGLPVIATDRGYIAELMRGCDAVIPADADFPTLAVTLLKTWSADRNALYEAGGRSRARFDQLIQISERQFRALLEALSVDRPHNGGKSEQA